ncbi:hypothetical protein L1049_014880 [Liquidambar formosana]|uniref:Protein kinase domain-containing protein n=1 Tax=Liquidambar formosana TaxID=63359 RepID=A0AAP0RX86_LIQFO
MLGSTRSKHKICSLLRKRTVQKRTIIIGLKSDSSSRDMLLRLLSLVATPGDNVLAVHVQEPNDTFDPNTFNMHEDLCRSKQVDFQVKVCVRNSFISELTHQVRINFATILALGCSTSRPKNSVVVNCLKGLPPTCSLLVMDSGGRILIQRQGTSQQGSANKIFLSSLSCSSKHTCSDQSGAIRQLKKASTMPSPSTSSTMGQIDDTEQKSVNKTMLLPELMAQKPLQRLALLEAKGQRCFTSQELNYATKNFSPAMVIGEGGHSTVYRAKLEDGQAAAVKVLKATRSSTEDLLQEVELLSSIQHENIVQIIGSCYSKEMHAIVYNLQKENLKRKLRQLSLEHICPFDLQARSLLSCGLCEYLIDPYLNEDYNMEEMKTMMMAARLCLLHSSSRRPTMKVILRLFEEPEYWLKKQREREEFINGISSRGETGLWRHDDLDSNEMLVIDDT